MQWLIDIVYDAVMAQLAAAGIFANRGDPAAADWTQLTLSQDGAWHTLDLSAIVPAGAKAVLFAASISSPLPSRILQLRRHGNANTLAVSKIETQVAGVTRSRDLICPVDSDRKADYYVSSPVWIAISLTVKGWWI